MGKGFTYNRKKLSNILLTDGWNKISLSEATGKVADYKKGEKAISESTANRAIYGTMELGRLNLNLVVRVLAKEKGHEDTEQIKKEIEFEVNTDEDKKVNNVFDGQSKNKIKSTDIYRAYFDNFQPENISISSKILIEIEDDEDFKELFVESKLVRITNQKIIILSSFNENLIDILRTPKKPIAHQPLWDKSRKVKFYNNNDLILGRVFYFEQVSLDQYLLGIEKDNSSSRKSFEYIKAENILNILLFNKLNFPDTPLNNALTEALPFYSFEIINSLLYTRPVCPIPWLYKNYYLKDRNWNDFCLRAKAAIIEASKILGFIDIIDRLELVQKDNDKIEVYFSAILNIVNTCILGLKVELRDECDLSLHNFEAYNNSSSNKFGNIDKRIIEFINSRESKKSQ